MLDPQEKNMLTRALELAEDNNKILNKMRRSQKWTRIFHTVYWVIIIGTAVGAYYLIQPYVESLLSTFGLGDNVESLRNILE